MNEQAQTFEPSAAAVPIDPLPALSPEEERVERLCCQLARIIRGIVDLPSPDAPNTVEGMEEKG